MKSSPAKAPAFKKRMIVRPSGKGRTAQWPATEGTVSRVSKGTVFVQWDGTNFEDEMEPAELKSTGRLNSEVPNRISVVSPKPRGFFAKTR